jgi:hypothetical protein
MQLYFKNLGNQTISLRLDLPTEYYDAKNPVQDLDRLDGEQTVPTSSPAGSIVPINTIFQFIIKEHPKKLQQLYINEFSLEYLPLFIGNIDSSVGLPNLKKLHIAWYQGAPNGHDWDNDLPPLPTALVPRLTDISLGQNSPGFSIHYGQLTDISLEYIAVDRCMEIITLCSTVSECHIFYPSPPSDWAKEVPTKPVTLSHTTCLGWAFGFQKWDVAFLKLFTFPALKRFRCEDQDENGFQVDQNIAEEDRDIRQLQRRFLSRCPKLTVYERAAETFSNWTFWQLCDDLPDTIEELYLRNVEVSETARISAVLSRGDDWRMEIFPQLKILELQGKFWHNMSSLLPDIVTMLESRRRVLPEQYKNQARLEELYLKWNTEDETPPKQLTEVQKAQLQDFVNEGLKVTTIDAEGNDMIWSPTTYHLSGYTTSNLV